MAGELGWDHAIEDIGETSLDAAREATPQEREAIAQALDLVACARLTVQYRIAPRGEGHFRMSGALQAEVTQTCVVSLEPVVNQVAENFAVDFWPQAEMPPPSSGELDMDDESEPEPIAGGVIDAGRIAFECLAAALDPFPRKPGATLDWQAPQAPAAPENPFAVLARIKEKK
jgi:hypothetical protein